MANLKGEVTLSHI